MADCKTEEKTEVLVCVGGPVEVLTEPDGTKNSNCTPFAAHSSWTKVNDVACSSGGHLFAVQDPMYEPKDTELQIHSMSRSEQP